MPDTVILDSDYERRKKKMRFENIRREWLKTGQRVSGNKKLFWW